MDLPAGSCLLPGREHPPGPAELLPTCFNSGSRREKPNHATLEGAGFTYGVGFAHFCNPCGWRRPDLAGFFSVCLPRHFEQSAFSVAKSHSQTNQQCLAQVSFWGISCVQTHLYFYISTFLSHPQSCPGCCYVAQIPPVGLRLALAGRRKSAPFSCSHTALFWGQNCSCSEFL